MACPFFLPVERLGPGPWDPAPRLTLGEAWAGVCHAHSFTPTEEEQRNWCNRGYARNECRHFPNETLDAVRFAWNARRELLCILEKDHVPVEFAVIDPNRVDEPRASQARAFMQCWPE